MVTAVFEWWANLVQNHKLKCLYSTYLQLCLCFPVCLFEPPFRWGLPRITVLWLVTSPEMWSLAGWDLECVSELGCVMGSCSQWISSHRPYKVEEVYLYRLMGRKGRLVPGAPWDQQIQGHQDYLSHHARRFCHLSQCLRPQVHLRTQKHLQYYVNLKWKNLKCLLCCYCSWLIPVLILLDLHVPQTLGVSQEQYAYGIILPISSL